MIIDDLIARLTIGGTPFAIIEGANGLAEVKDRPKATPAVYVYVKGDASGPNQRATGPVMQRTEVDIALMIITDNLTGAIGVARDIETLKTWSRNRLLGFLPASAANRIEHLAGEIVQIKNNMVWFEDVFATAYYQKEQP